MNRMYKAFVLAGAVLLLSANFVSAADIVGPKDSQENFTVGAEETHHNLYTGASTLTVNGATTGDAFLAGGTVTQNGNVEQDLAAAGGTLILNGTTGGDLRAAGGTITVNGPVTGDVLIAGGTVNLTEKASVGGDLILAGGTVDIAGSVIGSVRVYGGKVRINSKITGEVWVEAGEQLTFGPKAEVTGKVTYRGPKQAIMEAGAQVSPIQFTATESKSGGGGAFKAFFTGALLIKLLAWIIAILLLIKLMPAKTKTAIEIAHAKPWASLGIGFLALVATPIAVIILFITFIGYYVALAVLSMYVTMLIFSALIGSLFLGNLLIKWLTKKPDQVLDWQSAVIGVAVYMVLSFIPFVGWLACAILMLIALGSLVQMVKKENN